MKFISLFFKPSKLNYSKVRLHDTVNDQLYSVDEITASDLQLEDFINRYDQCNTTCGSDLFFHWLYSVKNQKDVESVQKDMQTVAESGKTGIVSGILKKNVGKQKEGCLVRDLWNGFSIQHMVIDNFYAIYFSNLILNTGFSFLLPKYILFFILSFIVINFVLFVITNNYISHVTASLGYFFSLCNALRKIEKKVSLNLTVPVPDYKKFTSLRFYSLFFKQGIGGPSSGDFLSLLIDYFRIFFAFELYSFKKVEKSVLKNQNDIRNIYLYIGYLDCLVNNLHIMEEYGCCYSEIRNEMKIDFKNLRHPLVKNSQGQSKCINKNLIVTGLNMSGKTTFMKSVGINQILATSFGFCFADSFSTSIKDVLSSICINDSLLNGKSRYYAEAERLIKTKKILQDHTCLCLVDEILSGTNSEERIEGATRILEDFAVYDSILIAATHDLLIAQNLSGSYEPVYFDGEIENDRIIFDYEIKDGIVSKKNGLLILKLLDSN